MGVLIAGEYRRRFGVIEESLADPIPPRPHPQTGCRLSLDVPPPIRTRSRPRTEHVRIIFSPYDLERGSAQFAATPPDVFEHDESATEEEPESGQEDPCRGTESVLEQPFWLLD